MLILIFYIIVKKGIYQGIVKIFLNEKNPKTYNNKLKIIDWFQTESRQNKNSRIFPRIKINKIKIIFKPMTTELQG
jgi:hypothetical protein